MPRDEFDTTEYVKMVDIVGELVMFMPTEHIDEYETSFGTKDAILTTIVVFDKDGGYTEYFDQTVLQGAMIGALKRRLPVYNDHTGRLVRPGRPVLGRIEKGEAKKGQNAPYRIGDSSEADKAFARQYLTENPRPADPELKPGRVDAAPGPAISIPNATSPHTTSHVSTQAAHQVVNYAAHAVADAVSSDDPWAV